MRPMSGRPRFPGFAGPTGGEVDSAVRLRTSCMYTCKLRFQFLQPSLGGYMDEHVA